MLNCESCTDQNAHGRLAQDATRAASDTGWPMLIFEAFRMSTGRVDEHHAAFLLWPTLHLVALNVFSCFMRHQFLRFSHCIFFCSVSYSGSLQRSACPAPVSRSVAQHDIWTEDDTSRQNTTPRCPGSNAVTTQQLRVIGAAVIALLT